mmetsp:Transcript_30364/g.54346  ORF Transcript_30364/g.54346 Transcript_30364/m.54346 type:complete len:203 (+) Transcript_30364:922-1530(+)
MRLEESISSPLRTRSSTAARAAILFFGGGRDDARRLRSGSQACTKHTGSAIPLRLNSPRPCMCTTASGRRCGRPPSSAYHCALSLSSTASALRLDLTDIRRCTSFEEGRAPRLEASPATVEASTGTTFLDPAGRTKPVSESTLPRLSVECLLLKALLGWEAWVGTVGNPGPRRRWRCSPSTITCPGEALAMQRAARFGSGPK